MVEKSEKTSLYLLGIVGIVAVVGIVILILNSGDSGVSLRSLDLSGQAVASKNIGTKANMSTSEEAESFFVRIYAEEEKTCSSICGEEGYEYCAFGTLYIQTVTDELYEDVWPCEAKLIEPNGVKYYSFECFCK